MWTIIIIGIIAVCVFALAPVSVIWFLASAYFYSYSDIPNWIAVPVVGLLITAPIDVWWFRRRRIKDQQAAFEAEAQKRAALDLRVAQIKESAGLKSN